MSIGYENAALAERVVRLRGEIGDQVSIDDIADVVTSLMHTVEGDISAGDLRVYHELSGIIDYIRRARDDIATLLPDDIAETNLNCAKDELDAVVQETEVAAGSFMDAAEKIEDLAAEQPETMAAKLNDIATGIYEASTFQDITGQRINKVVGLLRQVEERLAGVAAMVDDRLLDQADAVETGESMAAEPADADLLHGPSMAAEANSQDDIDALLASFD